MSDNIYKCSDHIEWKHLDAMKDPGTILDYGACHAYNVWVKTRFGGPQGYQLDWEIP